MKYLMHFWLLYYTWNNPCLWSSQINKMFNHIKVKNLCPVIIDEYPVEPLLYSFFGLLLLHHMNLDPYDSTWSQSTNKFKYFLNSMRYSSKFIFGIHYQIEISSVASPTLMRLLIFSILSENYFLCLVVQLEYKEVR